MARDTRAALKVRTGCPRILDYKQSREPFFHIKEYIARHLLSEERASEYLKIVALQHIGAQGYPGFGAVMEYADSLRSMAGLAVKNFGRAYLPWHDWPTPEEEKKLQEAELAAESQDLIDAWIQRFEPENAKTQG